VDILYIRVCVCVCVCVCVYFCEDMNIYINMHKKVNIKYKK
jgi:hypothetical protein